MKYLIVKIDEYLFTFKWRRMFDVEPQEFPIDATMFLWQIKQETVANSDVEPSDARSLFESFRLFRFLF